MSVSRSASHRIARMLLSRAGLGPQDVTFQVHAGPAATVAAFRSGQVDALCYHDPLITQLEQGGELRVVNDTRTMRGNAEVFGGPLPAGSLCASSEFVSENPRQCQAMASALVHALKWLQTAAPADIVKTVPPDESMGERSLYLAALARVREAISPDGLMPEGGPETSLRALSALDPALAARRPDLTRTFTQEFARKAKQKFSA